MNELQSDRVSELTHSNESHGQVKYVEHLTTTMSYLHEQLTLIECLHNKNLKLFFLKIHHTLQINH